MRDLNAAEKAAILAAPDAHKLRLLRHYLRCDAETCKQVLAQLVAEDIAKKTAVEQPVGTGLAALENEFPFDEMTVEILRTLPPLPGCNLASAAAPVVAITSAVRQLAAAGHNPTRMVREYLRQMLKNPNVPPNLEAAENTLSKDLLKIL